MMVSNYFDSLNRLDVDNNTGIKISQLTDDTAFSLYIAEIAKGKTLPAHYHQDGVEAYTIISGQGEFAVGKIFNNCVVWMSKVIINSGDCFSIQPKEVHSLTNTGNRNMQILFCAPPSHLKEDRIFISDIKEDKL